MEPQTQPLPPPSPKNHTKRNLLIISSAAAIAAIAAVTAVLIWLYWPSNKTGDGAANKTQTDAATRPEEMAEQVLTNPADGSEVIISQTNYYSLTAGGTTYYGPLLKINDSYLRILPTAYKNQGQLATTTDELHGPESATFFSIKNIADVHKLNDTSPDDAAIIKFVKPQVSKSSYAYPSDKIDSYLKTSQIQAFFFKDGMTLFAKTSTLEGNFLAGAKQVYYMASANGQISLAVAKPDQYANRTSNELLQWQNLRFDSKVAQAIAAFEENNP